MPGLDSENAGTVSPEAGSEGSQVLETFGEAALASDLGSGSAADATLRSSSVTQEEPTTDWDWLRLRVRVSIERLTPTSTHPTHYWTVEQTHEAYPVPAEVLERMCKDGEVWHRAVPECDRLLQVFESAAMFGCWFSFPRPPLSHHNCAECGIYF